MNSKHILIYDDGYDCYFVGVREDLNASAGFEDVSDNEAHLAAAMLRGIDVSEVNKKRNPMYQAMRVEFQRKAVAHQMWATCLNCEHWCDGDMAKTRHLGAPDGWKGCILQKQMPPPEIIVHGCNEHDFNIPF